MTGQQPEEHSHESVTAFSGPAHANLISPTNYFPMYNKDGALNLDLVTCLDDGEWLKQCQVK
jgi:hypothetical protein